MVNEYGGERIVANVPWPGASPMPAGIVKTTAADFTGDGRADLVGVEAATGKLWPYPGKGNGTFGDRVRPRRARRPHADRRRLVRPDPTH
ncbi:hypothetical protein ACFYM2_31380 [Streptomyces sp. NPDC006711]|uniref:hypothetical protein n=1 Tax=Streptomyces sp. NPDC006711 TaxID=3364762 RepID=UPI0036901684